MNTWILSPLLTCPPAGYSTATKKSLSYTPDLTSGAAHSAGAGGCYEYGYSDNNSNNSLKSAQTAHLIAPGTAAQLSELRPLSEHFYEQPMRVLASNTTPPSSEAAPAPSPGPLPASLGVPRCADQQQVTWTRVGEAGAKVTIPRSAVSLTVPQGAIEPGRAEEVWVAVVAGGAGPQPRPRLEQGEVLLTPVVVVGPPHLTAHLKKPVVVSIPHIGGAGVREVRVLQCEQLDPAPSPAPGPPSPPAPASWRCVAVSGQEDALSSTSVYVDSSMAQLVTERLAAFALVANVSDLSCLARSSLASSGCSSLASAAASETAFRIPVSVKASLAQLLDPPAPNNNDWRLLAERLGVTRYTSFFSAQPSPTEAILNLWEARHRESTAVAGLVNTLRGMARHDAAQVLDMDTSWP